MPAKCIVCEEEHEDINDTDEAPADVSKGVYPSDGTYFTTYGNYGSTVFDPMDGSWVQIAICNDCLANKRHCLYGPGLTHIKRDIEYERKGQGKYQ